MLTFDLIQFRALHGLATSYMNNNDQFTKVFLGYV